MKSGTSRKPAAITIGLLLLVAVLAALARVPEAASDPRANAEAAPSTRIATTDTSPPQNAVDPSPPAIDPWPDDADTVAAFRLVRGSSINDDPLAAAEQFIRGQLRVGRYGDRLVSGGVDWAGEGESRSYLRLLHGQFILNDLASAYQETSDETFLDAAYAHVRSWEANNPMGAPASDMAWHDETTARRLMNWLGLLEASRDYSDQEAVDALWTSAAEHAALLATDEFHATGTNHGMFQDQALLAYAAVLPDRVGALAFLDVARERLLAYFDTVISSDGVHLEHSPAYNQLIVSAILRYQEYFDLIGDTRTVRLLAGRVEGMARYATYVIQPDGTFPLVGDTFEQDLPRKGLFDNDEYAYARTAGLEGVRPTYIDAVFPEAGYAILRDKWSSGGAGTYVHFTAAYHGAYHKHSDELSVWIYHDGELLTESGPNGYDYDDPLTQFAYSSAAHNTLLVDGEGLPRVDGYFERTYLESYEIADQVSSATGVTTRYEGVIYTRTVSLDRVAMVLTVTDRIKTDTSRRFTLLWHVAPGVDSQMFADGDVLLLRSGSEVARVSAESADVAATVRLVPDSPDLTRSLRLGGGPPESTSVIVIEFQAEDTVELVTTIELFSTDPSD